MHDCAGFTITSAGPARWNCSAILLTEAADIKFVLAFLADNPMTTKSGSDRNSNFTLMNHLGLQLWAAPA